MIRRGTLWICCLLTGMAFTAKGQWFDVTKYGAVGDSLTDNTAAIQKAVDACALTGGKVYFPAGKFLTATIYLKSNVTLHIAAGATILGHTDTKRYPCQDAGIRFYGDEWAKQSLIFCKGQENVGIEGNGTIDGQGAAFVINTIKKPDRYRNRPYLLWFAGCKNVRVRDVTLRNSAFWMQHYLGCEFVWIDNLRIWNHSNKNNDMIDIDGCRNVSITGVIGDSDDDGITIKSTSPHISENIVITNCVVSSHCNALKLGTESTGGFRNITISNCVVKPSAQLSTIYGLPAGNGGLALELVDGGIMENVSINNVAIEGPQVPIFLRLGNRARPFMKGAPVPAPGRVRNISLSNITATGADETGCSISGLTAVPIEGITLQHIRIETKGGGAPVPLSHPVPEQETEYPEGTMFGKLPAYGLYIRHARDIKLSDITIRTTGTEIRPGMMLVDTRQYSLNGLDIQSAPGVPGVYVSESRDSVVNDSYPAQKPPAAIAQPATPLELSCRVADKMIQDTRFEWNWAPQTEVLGMQVIDLRFLQLQPGQTAYALQYAKAPQDTLVRFGITAGGSVQVWVNRQPVWQQDSMQVTRPAEVAYNRFDLARSFTAQLRKGDNEILVRYGRTSAAPVAFLRAVTPAGDLDASPEFSKRGWIYAGPFAPGAIPAPADILQPVYGKNKYWRTAPQPLLPDLAIDSQAAYRRESYADWHYANGTAVWSILALANEAETNHYLSFVKKYAHTLLDNLAWFRWQYDSLYAWRGGYHRVFRRTMLDDAGAPALPFAGLYLREKDSATGAFLEPLINYVYTKQVRLQDGTFCRPEPVAFTVWADDLFMSVPFLMAMSKATGRQEYLEDAVKQVIQFRRYLLDPQTGLYRHGWFSNTGRQSVACWGRANGWVAWATVELLDGLPSKHPAYKTVLQAFRRHMGSLIKYQAADGMWRQLLDKPAAYEETSCTAMFALAMARGVRKGWLPGSYKQYATKAWEAVAAKIDRYGIVHGICRGTEIGNDEQFYLERKTLDQDPRGLGAVITAGMEVAKLK